MKTRSEGCQAGVWLSRKAPMPPITFCTRPKSCARNQLAAMELR